MSTLSEPRRPRLLPQNRKLRHLKGLSLRNLTFAPATSHTADDAAVLGSPSKLVKLRDAGHLHPSRSSDSLLRDGLRAEKRRPPAQPRRTSLSLSHASPSVRQKKLESLLEASVGDVFFSLHVPESTAPIYISEVRSRSANFNFQFFDLSAEESPVSRSCIVSIRVWAKRPQQPSWVFLLQELIDLRRLNFVGTLMDRRFPPNAVILHLEDGVYSLDFPPRTADPKQARQAPPAATSSYRALMKLANLDSLIRDAVDTQHAVTRQINQILEESPGDPAPFAAQQVSLADKLVATQQRANKTARKRRDELLDSLRSRREAISSGRRAQAAAQQDIANNREKLAASAELLRKTGQQIRGQRRRICSELSDMFPIATVPDAPPLAFQIRNLPLPNSTYDAATARAVNEDVLSAALGLAAMLTWHLQFYLSCPLPYPLSPCGSRSYVRDDISHMPRRQPRRRQFPLYLPRGGSTVAQWRFEYGWFLLNKNIEALCASQGLKVVDIRHSLPNLKYLLYVCSAGTDEVPGRKKGGVRGLWAGRLKSRVGAVAEAGGGGSAGGSRRGSADGEVASPERGDGWGADSGVGLLPFGDDASFTLRTKGLRENVA
ncbi:p63 related protein [Metarhizium album ARSEF 1941]|uniref:Autophagy-related protein 14 n=1 Tax=Metarhizium album (strain ARSEF 1941) TaxID=1081103 RepID=A0A0B2WLB1_METAS|nr:p63 related protein [Metarhizium album ARSEF 1941]KHN94728.1 p63 related protein [Metarhizium album ARSEF 1941]